MVLGGFFMKQVILNLKTGKIEVVDVPCPQARQEHLLMQTKTSLVSAGTERMLVEFGNAGYLSKAKNQPDRVKQALDKIRTDGLMPTIEVVRAKLDQPIPMGYCNVGTVQRSEVRGQGSEGFKAGERVVSNGPHAEVVCVPKNLCAKVPDNVSDEEAAFAVVGAIGLQGVRLAQPTLGEAFVVMGLGLIGQLTTEILLAHGCKVLGIDVDSAKCDLASQFGAETVDLSKGEDALDAAMAFSKGRGMDGVLITAATKSNEPVHQAAQMCRKRGRIVLVGVTGLQLNRSDFYEKELSFQVSCSFGPGRYDSEYEEKGHDYPFGFVRWTEQRNVEAVLDLMAAGKLDVNPLISHRFRFEEVAKAYELIGRGKESYVGIVLTYGESGDRGQRAEVSTIGLKTAPHKNSKAKPEIPVVGLIGAGNFTGQVVLPVLQKIGVRLKAIASRNGITGTHLGKKFDFEESTTDAERIFTDSEINTVVVTTRHDTHARFVMEALKAGKNVFVEKPLCLTLEELAEIKHAYYSLITNNDSQMVGNSVPLLMVGFNRRFAPHILKMKQLLDGVKQPKSMIMTVNAGMIPADHWAQDAEVGGGRIIGEACHFIDLLRFLAGGETVKYDGAVMQSPGGDTASINLSFADGSIGTVPYFANGNKRLPKERLEVFCGGKILQLDNFKVLRGYGWKGFKKMKLWRQDKGHENEIRLFIDAVTNGGTAPIGFEEIVEVTRVTLELAADGR